LLYEEFRTDSHAIFHYFSVFLVRRFIYVLVCYFYYLPEQTIFQVFVNIYLSFLFLLYLIHFRPYVDKDINRLQVINEGAFLLMSYQIIAFTDFNPDVDIKSLFGWTMVFTSGLNFVFPNLYLVCVGMWPDIKDAFFTKKVPEDPKKALAR